MKVRLLKTEGKGYFEEVMWDKPEPDFEAGEIEVQACLTGICRSDIDMMVGKFGPLPLHMQGHEGLGRVTRADGNTQVSVGDYVATRGEPAYADFYNVKRGEFVIVPENKPDYILEPMACGINLIKASERLVRARYQPGARVLILGSGFLAFVAYAYLTNEFPLFEEIDVVGNHNKDWWGKLLKTQPSGLYDVVVDLGSDTQVLDKDYYQNNALIIFGVQKPIQTDFAKLLWKSCSMTFPSPSSDYFLQSMELAKIMVQRGSVPAWRFWTNEYARNDWERAFKEGLYRPPGYVRGYLRW